MTGLSCRDCLLAPNISTTGTYVHAASTIDNGAALCTRHLRLRYNREDPHPWETETPGPRWPRGDQ